MSATNVVCDQAIFTSVKTPMGEGYRIIAASKGIKADEKQTITRNSPSHDSLCANVQEDASAYAIAFYLLPSRRMCLAYSCFAGAEHTGRGGQRIYTLNIVFDEMVFAQCGYNPFQIVRAVVAQGCTTPQLKPPKVLPELQLALSDIDNPALYPASIGKISAEWLEYLLQAVFSQKKKNIIIHSNHGWLDSAEALYLGIPGPMRGRVPFSAGLRFSVGRAHRLQWFRDDHGAAKKRIAGQPYIYVEPDSDILENVEKSAWSTFVRRHWECSDLSGLSRRTSKPFREVKPEYIEEVGSMYNMVDEITQLDTPQILTTVSEHLKQKIDDEIEIQITQELIQCAQHTLADRFNGATWMEISSNWETLLSLWRQSQPGTSFANPLIEQVLHPVKGVDPISAAEAAVGIAKNIPASLNQEAHASLLENVLNRVCDWSEQAVHATASDAQDIAVNQVAVLQELAKNWKAIRPGCPIVARFIEACDSLAEKIALTSSST